LVFHKKTIPEEFGTLEREVRQQMEKYKFCQSCGMPFGKDPHGGGTLKDGSKCSKFCSFCYKDGEFIGGDVSLKEFQEHTRKAMIKDGANSFLAWLFTRKMFLKNLERWKGK